MKLSLVLLISLATFSFKLPHDFRMCVYPVTDTLVYPFDHRDPINWQLGQDENAVLVLKSLKEFMDGNIKASMAYFADSLVFIANGFYYQGKKDSLEKMFMGIRAQMQSMRLDFDTWQVMDLTGKKEHWVTLWYKQIWTTRNGGTDSVYLVNKCEVKNNQIVRVEELQRQFPAAVGRK